MKSLLLIIICGMLLLCGCEFHKTADPRLVKADSLITIAPDSAYSILKDIDSKSLSGEVNRAYYALLYTQAQYKNADSFDSDSLINIAIEYYADNHDREKNTRALMYKGAALSDMGDIRNAMEWYKKAEENADSSDYMNLGQINIRMGGLYRDTYISNDADIDKFKNALHYYKMANSEKYQLASLSTIGAQYRIGNIDSAYFYINKAIRLAKKIGDNASMYNNLSVLAGAYYTDSLFYKAKETAIYAVKNGKEYLYNDDCYNFASCAYSNLGMVDSAEYYLRQQSIDLAPEKEVRRLLCLIAIEKAKGNYKKVHEYDIRGFKLADSLLRNSSRRGLFTIEKLYDKRTVELQNAELKKKNERTYFIIVCITLLLIIIVILFVFYTSKKQKLMQDSLLLIDQLKKESIESQNTLLSKLDNESKLKEALEHQFNKIKQLIEYSYRCGNNTVKFMAQFKESVRLNKLTDNFWKDIRYFVDENHNNVLTRLSTAYPTLTEEELNFIGLLCCKFSYLEITVCMGYANEHSTCNKRWRIAKKMGIQILLDDYLQQLIGEDKKPASK